VITGGTAWVTGATTGAFTGTTTGAVVLVTKLVGEEPGPGREVAASACWAHQALMMKAVATNANSIITKR
jgi:hypothetical protein